MKKWTSLLAGLTLAASVMAGDADLFIGSTSPSSTNTASTPHLDGYIYSVTVRAPTAWTGVVALATSEDGTFLTTTSTTQTNKWFPRLFSVHNTSAATVTLTNTVRMVYLSHDSVSCTVTSTSTASTNDIHVVLTLVPTP